MRASERQREIAQLIVRQLEGHGIPARIVSRRGETSEPRSGESDLRLERTWGIPYDPTLSLAARFLPAPRDPSAASPPTARVSQALAHAVRDLISQVGPRERRESFSNVQAQLDELASVVPLFVARRLAVIRKGLRVPALDHDIYRFRPETLFAEEPRASASKD